MLAYTKANREVNVRDKHYYVIYVEDKEDNGLRVGDELIKVNGKEIEELTEFTEVIKKSEVGIR